MRQHNAYLGFAIIFTFIIAACAAPTPLPRPTPSITPTVTRISPTNTPTPTFTLTPTFTPSPSPTPLGGNSPKIAFYGKDTQGNINLYIGNLYEEEVKAIMPFVPVPKYVQFLPIKWSPNGKSLVFLNGNDRKGKSLFLFETVTGSLREVVETPKDKAVFYIKWSVDQTKITYATASASSPTARFWSLDLASGVASHIENTLSVSGLGNEVCDTFPAPDWLIEITPLEQRWSLRHYGWSTCLYPDMNAYQMYKVKEDTRELLLISQDGTWQKTLAIFSKGVDFNGGPYLLLSPNKESVLLMGEFNGANGIAYPVKLSESEPPLVLKKDVISTYKSYSILERALANVIAFGWSPDSKYFIASVGDYSVGNARETNDSWKIVVIDAQTGKYLYEYHPPKEIEPMISVGQRVESLDVVWPVQY